MTSSTTILGVLPLAVGSSTASAGAMDALGRALVGGLVTGTLLTLYVVPLCYTLIDDARFWLRDFFGEIVTLGGVSAGSLR